MGELSSALQIDLQKTAHALADIARPIALKYFRGSDQNIENKLEEDFDPVTVADREIEKAMRTVLAEMRPHDSILGEEFGHSKGSSGLEWVLDPIDGTRGFISGTPTWGVLIAVGPKSGPIYGIIDQPFTGERFVGGLGHAEWQHNQNIKSMKTRVCSNLSDAILFSTFPEVGSKQERAAFESVRDQVKLTRYGMDCYAYGLLAMGQVDLVIEAGLNAYDIQGPIAVVQAAGGVVTDWNGGPVHQGGCAIAAGDHRLHRMALELLSFTD